MEMEEAFNLMLGSLYSVHAGRPQVLGVLAWRETACTAAARGRALGERAPVSGAGVTVKHGQWTAVCKRIVGALRAMEQRAEYMAIAEARNAEAAERAREQLMAAAAGAADDPALRNDLLARAMEAERARKKAELRKIAARAWWQACNDAAAQGEFLAREQDSILAPVVQTVADNGGLAETALDKEYHQIGAFPAGLYDFMKQIGQAGGK